MTAYYNEYEPKKAAWLRELINRSVIAPGVVDERSILDVRPDEIAGFDQVHLCAGIGIWSYALRLAGWQDDRAVWTVSEPCQPHSAAGKGLGVDDPRYLRWAIHHHVQHGKRPDIPVYGEQVANGDGLAWLDTLSADMEEAQHTVRAFDLCSAGFGAPHIRQRLYWLANATGTGFVRWGASETSITGEPAWLESQRLCDAGGLAHSISERGCGGESGREDATNVRQSGEVGRMAHTKGIGSGKGQQNAARSNERDIAQQRAELIGHCSDIERAGPTNGFWRAADWLLCRDGKWRPVRPGTFPLVNGAAARVLRLCGYGDGINAEQAAWFIKTSQGLLT